MAKENRVMPRAAFVLTLALVMSVLSAGAMAEPSADRGTLSWGKVGVSFLQYRTDAVECTTEGTLAELPETPSQLETPPPMGLDMPDIHAYVTNLRMQAMQQSRQARASRQEIVDLCLMQRGYQPFLLTDDQRSQLRAFDRGTIARHRFLYSLATDADILAHQGV